MVPTVMEIRCPDESSLAHAIPLAAAAVLVASSLATQWSKPASYGKFHGSDPKETAKWEALGTINQRLGHTLSDAGPTLCGFAAFYWALVRRSEVPLSASSLSLLALWLLHYVQRGIIHPLLMRYRAARVPALITIAGLVPNSLFTWLNASAIACLQPCVSPMWHHDPRFIVGVAVYAVGFVVNRSADWTLRSLRSHPDKAAEYVRLLSAFARQCNTLTRLPCTEFLSAGCSRMSHAPITSASLCSGADGRWLRGRGPGCSGGCLPSRRLYHAPA
jgi:hypothetical protein